MLDRLYCDFGIDMFVKPLVTLYALPIRDAITRYRKLHMKLRELYFIAVLDNFHHLKEIIFAGTNELLHNIMTLLNAGGNNMAIVPDFIGPYLSKQVPKWILIIFKVLHKQRLVRVVHLKQDIEIFKLLL